MRIKYVRIALNLHQNFICKANWQQNTFWTIPSYTTRHYQTWILILPHTEPWSLQVLSTWKEVTALFRNWWHGVPTIVSTFSLEQYNCSALEAFYDLDEPSDFWSTHLSNQVDQVETTSSVTRWVFAISSTMTKRVKLKSGNTSENRMRIIFEIDMKIGTMDKSERHTNLQSTLLTDWCRLLAYKNSLCQRRREH